MALFGGAMEMADGEIDSFDGGDHHHSHTAPSFKLLTLHSLAGFFMMFGWVGLSCSQQYGLTDAQSCVIAFVAGVCVMVVTACIFRSALLLEGSGTVFSIDKTIGMTGTMYQRISGSEHGKVHLVVNGITRELLAQSHDGRSIDSFVLVKVVKVIDHEIVEVIALKDIV